MNARVGPPAAGDADTLVGEAGGVFKATVGLFNEFGPERVRDTPISEQAILGAAMGAAMTGLRPIAEIMFSDFFAVCFDYIANEFPKSRYMSNGQTKCPLVVRTANGGGSRFGAQHSQSVENWCMMIPGLKVVAPSTPLEATLAEAWMEVLGVPEIGAEDNFFDAGGHSLLIVQLHRILTQRIETPLSLVDLYRFPTIRSLADHLGEGTSASEALDASAARGARRREMMRRRRGG